jgi:serine/threonine protein phosphatase PrpC
MTFYLKTDKGMKRLQNEDIVCAEDFPVGQMPDIFIVADGMGGYKAGDYASERTIEIVLDDIRRSGISEPVQALKSAIERANREIYEEARSDETKTGMGTTIVACTIDSKNHMTAANAGDSRLYVARNNEIRQVTYDHSFVEEMVRKGRMMESEARHHPNKHYITRAVGAEKDIEVDFFEEDLIEGDMVLLCSDGLSNMLTDDEIKEFLNSGMALCDITNALVERANEKGGNDNISCILICI